MHVILKPDFEDTVSIKCPKSNFNMHKILLAFFYSEPFLVKVLMTLRNRIVGFVGLKTGGSQKSLLNSPAHFKNGDKVGLFEIGSITDCYAIMGANDSHLDFRVIMSLQEDNLNCKTQVKFNNTFGKWYFFFIKPFHKFIVPMMLKSTIKNLQKNTRI